MAQLLYWCVYKFDLGPLGPTTLNLALRAWQKQSRRRLHFEPFFGRAAAARKTDLVKTFEAGLYG